MAFSSIDPAVRERLLEPPTGKVSVVLDSDMANEIDDQFALAWALLTPDTIDLKAVIAEPFSFAHHRAPLLEVERLRATSGRSAAASTERLTLLEEYGTWLDRLESQGTSASDLTFVTPAEGVDLSVAESERVYAAAGLDPNGLVFRGADRYMPDAETPVASDGVDRLVELARESVEPLYVAAIGCITNVASALLLAPDIVDKIVVLWTSGYPSNDDRSNLPSLNLVQDVHAARVVLDSGVPFVYMPGYLIGQRLTVSQPEMQAWVKGTGPLGELLFDLYDNNPLFPMLGFEGHFCRTWVIWDLICIAWLVDPALVPTVIRPTPELGDDLRWDLGNSAGRHMMREAIAIDRDGVFRDLFTKLAEQ